MASQGLERMALRLLPLAAVVALSLAPSVLLYQLFGSLNSAFFEQLPIKLGGPIAAFFATMVSLWKMYRSSVNDDNRAELRLAPMLGNWSIHSRSSQSGKQAVSETKIENDGGELSIEGGTFFQVEKNNVKGPPIGDWTVDMAVTDGRRLQYVYTLNDMAYGGRVWKGFVSLTLMTQGKPVVLSGVWQVFGPEYHRGTIELRKNPLAQR